MRNQWGKCLISGILAASMCCQVALAAADPGQILGFGVGDRDIVLYLQNPGEEYEIQCQVGTSEAEKIESYVITEDPVPMETIILLDNSLSVADKYRPMINTIISELAANRMNGEQFTVATFSDQITYLIQNSSDYSQIKQAVDGISYQNQETYLTDVLYDVLKELNSRENITLKRIVIISDGVDNKTIGYTKEELYAQLEKTPYPIYTIGCIYKSNNEQLKNMFALSRITGAEAYLLDEVPDSMTIVNGVAAINQAVKVTITPKERDCDGTRKGINVIVTSGGQSVRNAIEVSMPFITIKETQPEESSPAVMTTAAVETEPMPQKFPLTYVLIAAGVLLAVVIAVVIILVLRKKEKENAFDPADPEIDEGKVASGEGKKHHTKLTEEKNQRKKNGTVYMWENHTPNTLILTDINNPIKRFEVPLEVPVLVGYNSNCQIRLNYDETISGEHCSIYEEGGKVYVANKSKTNGTILHANAKSKEGGQIVGTAELYTGCVLVLGKLNMKVEIR